MPAAETVRAHLVAGLGCGRLEHPLGSTLWIRGGHTAELWTAEEITVGESLPRCQLAVLTACEAAGGGLSRVDEATGLPAALTAAGVPTVVASLWPVDDDVAVLFTDRFYRALADALGGDLDVAVAALVHRVRTELRSMPRSEEATALGALIDRTRDVPAQARLKPARARRASGPERPFADPVHWAAFGVSALEWSRQEADGRQGAGGRAARRAGDGGTAARRGGRTGPGGRAHDRRRPAPRIRDRTAAVSFAISGELWRPTGGCGGLWRVPTGPPSERSARCGSPPPPPPPRET